MIHPGVRFREVGKSDSQFQEGTKLTRLVFAVGYPGFMDRTPEAIAFVGVIVPLGC